MIKILRVGINRGVNISTRTPKVAGNFRFSSCKSGMIDYQKKMAAYDPENIFSKILDGKIPAYKIFETEHALAFLDAFPMSKGHSLLIPKEKGHVELGSMSPESAAAFLKELPRLVAAVKAATGTAIKVVQNNGETAGQVVPHVHFHVIPVYSAHQAFKSSSSMIESETAKALLAEIQAKL